VARRVPNMKNGAKTKAPKAKAAKAKPGAEDAKPDLEDLIGAGSSGEDRLGSDEEDESGSAGAPSDASEEPSDDEVNEQLALREGDFDEGAPKAASKLLARVVAGQQPADLGAIKQRIHDAAAMLSSWRKAKQLGDKRTREEVLAGLIHDCSTYFGYAEELAEYFLRMFSAEQAVQFFEANEKSRPLTIRTNSLKARRASLMQALNARKVQVDPVGPWTKVGLKVYDAQVPVGATPEYLGGHYMIQSASSFVPVMALAPQQDETILDMAAAPGGKTTYIGQLMKNTGTLFANDLRKERCKALVANCHRLGLTNVVTTCMDGKKLMGVMPKLDRVLLDAPCSGSGIIARDPSVKVKRGAKDFEENSRLQKELLAVAIDMVDAGSKTGGYIVYSTCSVSVEENEAVIDHALRTRPVELVSFSSSVNFGVEGLTKYREKRFHPSLALTRRYYPHVHNMDGFFVAKLKKISNKNPERARKDRSKMADHIQVWGEEHWTPEMMESVVDFPEPGAEEAAGMDAAGKAKASGKPMNKRDRKKIKRQQILTTRAASTTTVGAAAIAAGACAAAEAGGKRKEPPTASEGAAAPKKGKGKKAKAGGEALAEAKATSSKKRRRAA